MESRDMLYFASDYMEGAHPAILQKLVETNLEKTGGYGQDPYSDLARERIRAACGTPEAEVFFLAGGTQTNATVIDALLHPWEGVAAAKTGHISNHEAGAIEAGGHKVIELMQENGKLSAETVRRCAEGYRLDDNRDHTVAPGVVYISQPTECGTLYSLGELEALSAVCREYGIRLYLDGARLAYALACPENDAALTDIARLCDAFYIGGTKCGTLFGEAVVFPKPGTVPHFFTIVKRHGALLAKGRIAGLQFAVLFEDGLYFRIGENAIRCADRIRRALREKGYRFYIESPTNQIFVVLDREKRKALEERVVMSFWENLEGDGTAMRLATGWATTEEDTDRLIQLL